MAHNNCCCLDNAKDCYMSKLYYHGKMSTPFSDTQIRVFFDNVNTDYHKNLPNKCVVRIWLFLDSFNHFRMKLAPPIVIAI